MAAPDRTGQFVRWLIFKQIMVVTDFLDLKAGSAGSAESYPLSARCEWLSANGIFQEQTFPISELRVVSPSELEAAQAAGEVVVHPSVDSDKPASTDIELV
jgi:hypothetical protein